MADLKAQQDIRAYSDSVLAQKVKDSSDAAFEEITRRYQGLIGSIAGRYSAAGFDHADFMQEGLLALLSACKSFDQSEEKASFRNYAAVCISNRFMSVIRSTHSKSTIPENIIVPFEEIELSDNNSLNPETLIMEQESTKDLLENIRNSLSPLEMDVLRNYLCGMHYTEIAEKLGITPKSVDNALQRIRKKISVN